MLSGPPWLTSAATCPLQEEPPALHLHATGIGHRLLLSCHAWSRLRTTESHVHTQGHRTCPWAVTDLPAVLTCSWPHQLCTRTSWTSPRHGP
uniref:Uncharacterized protein n=1 Tax=Rangifer tarandus platyrhynchus TaxID=3082113 RepID=A0ACB0ESN7_RANTA|nr:unnamed protein product [Rangifer tarandus platyrhynchus]